MIPIKEKWKSMGDKTYLCNQCGRWKPDGAYVLDDGILLWIGFECLTDEEKKEFYKKEK